MMAFSAQLAKGGVAAHLLSLYLPLDFKFGAPSTLFLAKVARDSYLVLSHIAPLPFSLGFTLITKMTGGWLVYLDLLLDCYLHR
jgi:hypothetical protein